MAKRLNHAARIVGLLLALQLAGCGESPAPEARVDEEASYDILIVGGSLVDGSGQPARTANIGISGDRIVSVDAATDAEALRRIEANGLVVVPGFIDPHTHALGDLLDNGRKQNANYLMQGVTTVVVGNDGGGVPEFESSLATLREQGTGTHVAFFAGHNNIRSTVMGLENRPATEEELEQMEQMLGEQMEAGALGLSTGLFYTPGSYAPTEEVVALAKVAQRYGGIYDSHMRSEGSYAPGLLASIDEVIDVAESADIPVHIAHLKALGVDVWGQSGDVVARIEAARERGLDVTADQYPYRASGTSFSSAIIPAWVRADSREAMFERIGNADLSDEILEEMADNLRRRGGPDSMLVTGDSDWRGMTLSEIADALETDPLSAAIEAVRDGDPSIASFNMKPDDIGAIAIQPWVMTGSDGSNGHPRKYATYPTVYRDMVLRDNLFSLERFVERSSALVADTLGLCDRGYIEAGRLADIVLLDLDNYQPVADFNNPTELASGVVYALVKGDFAIEGGNLTEALAGNVVNRQSLDCPSE